MFYPHTIKGKPTFKFVTPPIGCVPGAPGTPGTIASLVFWVDGDYGRLDLSCSGHVTENNGSTISTNVLNGHDVFEFDGASDFLIPNSPLTGALPRSYIAVYKADAGGTNTICGTSLLQIDGSWDILQARVEGDPYAAGYSSDLGQDTPDQQWKYAQVDYDGTTRNLYKNGVINDTGVMALNTQAGQEFIMGRSAQGEHLTGKIAAVYVFDAVLIPSEREAMNSYIETRFNL